MYNVRNGYVDKETGNG